MAGDYKGAQPPYQAENRAKRGLLSLYLMEAHNIIREAQFPSNATPLCHADTACRMR